MLVGQNVSGLAELAAYTQANPDLNPHDLRDTSDISTIWNGKSSFPDNLIEYSGRVCYHSTSKMGHAPGFIPARVREGHEDIIEHVVVSVRFFATKQPMEWRHVTPHISVMLEDSGTHHPNTLVTANARVWLFLFRRGLGMEALPILAGVCPSVFGEFETRRLEPFVGNRARLFRMVPDEMPPMRVTLLGYTQGSLPDTDNIEQKSHHMSATFLFEGISRALTHQLVRHRLAGHSQASQRYISRDKGEWSMVFPPKAMEDEAIKSKLEKVWRYLEDAYDELRDMGLKKEDARFILPNACETRIVTSMSFYAWRHFIWLRALDKAAQWEIRKMGQSVLRFLYMIAPDMFEEEWQTLQSKKGI